MFNPFLARLNARRDIEKKNDETIEVKDLKTQDTVYISRCVGCTITVTAEKVTKVVVDECDRCTINLETGIVATFETNKTKNSTFVIKSDNIHTVQVDSTTNSEFSFEVVPETFCLVSSDGCEGLTFELNKQKVPLVFPQASNQVHGDAIPQFKTTIAPNKSDIITEPVVREGSGHFAK